MIFSFILLSFVVEKRKFTFLTLIVHTLSYKNYDWDVDLLNNPITQKTVIAVVSFTYTMRVKAKRLSYIRQGKKKNMNISEAIASIIRLK